VATTTLGPATVPYPEGGFYLAKADETCQRVTWCSFVASLKVSQSFCLSYRLFDCVCAYACGNQIAKMFGVDLQELVQINKKTYPTLMMNSKLKKDTTIFLPAPEVRWILTKQIAKNKPEGKKKRVYSVQVLSFSRCPVFSLSLSRFLSLFLSFVSISGKV
jgi:hypothetical protein